MPDSRRNRGPGPEDKVLVSADSWILDAAGRWMDLARWVLQGWGEQVWRVDLAPKEQI
jgi:hypothetical protein